VKVVKESDKYYIWSRTDKLRVPNSLRADGAESNEVNFDVSTDSYMCEEYALKGKITDRQKKNADSALNLEVNKTKAVQDLLMLGQEQRVATLLTTTANWASTNHVTRSGTQQWNNASFDGDSTYGIEASIDTAKEAVRQYSGGYEPNTIIIPSAVAKVMKRDTYIRDLVKYTHADLLIDGDLPPKLWGLDVKIPKAVYVSSKKGASSDTYADVWGKNVILLYVPPTAGIDLPSAGYIFRAQNWSVSKWYEDKKKATFVEPSVIQDEVITSNVLGYLLVSVIA